MTCIARHFFLIVLIPMLFGAVRISLAQVAELCEQCNRAGSSIRGNLTEAEADFETAASLEEAE